MLLYSRIRVAGNPEQRFTQGGYVLFRRNDPAYERLRLKLKETRMEVGLTQAEVARMLRRPQSFIAKVETGNLRFDFLELQILAKIYGKSPSYYEDPSVTELFTPA